VAKRAALKLPVYNKQVVFIFDEAHRSQFGEAQKNLKKKFKMAATAGLSLTLAPREKCFKTLLL
jgi:type I site-specific restriction-modification system R (restriction) subunit